MQDISKIKKLGAIERFELQKLVGVWIMQKDHFEKCKACQKHVHPMDREEDQNWLLDAFNAIKEDTGMTPQEFHNFMKNDKESNQTKAKV